MHPAAQAAGRELHAEPCSRIAPMGAFRVGIKSDDEVASRLWAALLAQGRFGAACDLSAPYPRPCLAAMQRFLVVAALAFSVAAGDDTRVVTSVAGAADSGSGTCRGSDAKMRETSSGLRRIGSGFWPGPTNYTFVCALTRKMQKRRNKRG